MVGGAQEALNARPGVYKLVLKKRKGFIKIAIETGASLVPIFSFNEVEVFDQPSNDSGTKTRQFQDFFKKWTGIAPAFFVGRGFFQYSFGLIPRRYPITTVVGAPIDTVQNHTPTYKEIDELHEKFTAALVKLFEDHKQKYLNNPDTTHLEIE
jgi:2-acylglycerol O-acyltransferase 2